MGTFFIYKIINIICKNRIIYDFFSTKIWSPNKELRKAKGYTQEQLAEKLNIGVRSLGKIETGNSFPSMTTLEKIIETFQYQQLNCLIANIYNLYKI